jgi:hypothetical protein
MRRVNCRTCGIVVEEVPWATGKHQLTKMYMQFLAHWARQLSWKEPAETFHTSWEKVCHAVEYVVGWGLEPRTQGPLQAIGVDEIQYAKGHKYLTLVYFRHRDLRRHMADLLGADPASYSAAKMKRIATFSLPTAGKWRG